MSNSALYRMKRSVKIGTVSFVVCLLLAALLVAVNLLSGLLPAKLSRFDVSGSGLTSVTNRTKDFVKNMAEDVTIYWVVEEDYEDEQMRLFLSRYAEGGKHITVKTVDPTVDTEFLSKYGVSSMPAGGFVVESEKRFTTVDFRRMYLYTNPLFEVLQQNMSGILQPMSYDQINSVYEQYGSYIQYMLMMGGYSVEDITAYQTPVSFCGEAQLTAAIDYVTRDYIPHAYILAGYGEAKPSKALSELLSMLDAETLSLKETQSIPVDAGCLILFSPTVDMTVAEAKVVSDYLNAGGTLILNTSPETVETCPNIMSLGAAFGLTPQSGEVQEGDTKYFKGNPNQLLPTVNGMSASTDGSVTAFMPNSHAIGHTAVTGVTVTNLMTTSATAERVSLADKTTVLGEKGVQNIAVAATKTVGEETAYLLWFGSANAFTDLSETVNEAWNNQYYLYMAASASDAFSSEYSAIEAVALPMNTLGDMTVGWAVILGLILTLVIPVAILVTGIVIWVVRRRR